jgi:hypothetical protein
MASPEFRRQATILAEKLVESEQCIAGATAAAAEGYEAFQAVIRETNSIDPQLQQEIQALEDGFSALNEELDGARLAFDIPVFRRTTKSYDPGAKETEISTVPAGYDPPQHRLYQRVEWRNAYYTVIGITRDLSLEQWIFHLCQVDRGSSTVTLVTEQGWFDFA